MRCQHPRRDITIPYAVAWAVFHAVLLRPRGVVLAAWTCPVTFDGQVVEDYGKAMALMATTHGTKHALVEVVVGEVPCNGVFKQNTFFLRSHSPDVQAWNSTFMNHDFQFMDKLFIKKPPTTILDLGANVGFTTVYFANRYPDARVAAVEPSLGNFATASVNTLGNANIILFWGAIWDESQQVVGMTLPVDRGERCVFPINMKCLDYGLC
jgi:hypothetical protein